MNIRNYYEKLLIPLDASTLWAKPTLGLLMIWKTVGYYTILYLAALQGISCHLYEAATVDGVVEAINDQYPGFYSHVLNDDGSIHKKVRISVNGEDVLSLEGTDTPVKPGDHVYLLLAVAGG